MFHLQERLQAALEHASRAIRTSPITVLEACYQAAGIYLHPLSQNL